MWSALRLLLLLPAVSLALDLKPATDAKVLEGGVKIPVLRFQHEKGAVTWRPPVGWVMTSENGGLLFRVKGRTHATLELRVVPRVDGDSAALGNPDSLLRTVTGFLPKTGTEVVATGGNEGPFTLNGLAAREFLFDFQEPGHPTKASFNVVELNARERLIVLVMAQPKDFDEVRKTAIESLFSWEAVEK
jgi:hypothetical protein